MSFRETRIKCVVVTLSRRLSGMDSILRPEWTAAAHYTTIYLKYDKNNLPTNVFIVRVSLWAS